MNSSSIFAKTLLQVNASTGTNIIDYSKCELNKGINNAGSIVDNVLGYAISGYLPVKQGDEIIANTFLTESNSWRCFVVYNSEFNVIRTIANYRQYTYQEGDAYIRCMFIGSDIQTCRANYGTTLHSYVEYNPVEGYLSDVKSLVNSAIASSRVATFKSMIQKADAKPYNLINPEDTELGFINTNGGIYNNSDYSVSGYIPVNGQSIKSNGAIASNIGLNVYDKDFSLLRTLLNTSTYTFQEGDAYVRITFETAKIGVSARANYGTTLNAYVKYNPIDKWIEDYETEIDEKLDDLNEKVIKTVTIERGNWDPGWKIDNKRANGVDIAADGTLTTQGGKTALVGIISFLEPNVSKVYMKMRAYILAGNSSALYAFYSDPIVQNASTCVGVGEQITAGSSNNVEYYDYTVDVPDGAKCIVVLSYAPDTNYELKGDIVIDDTLEENTNKIKENQRELSLKEINNGTPVVYADVNSFRDDIASFSTLRSLGGYVDKVDNIILFRDYRENTNFWIFPQAFNPSNDKLVHVKLSVKYLMETPQAINVCVASGTNGASLKGYVGVISKDGDYEFTFDPTYYRIYQGMSDIFYVWFFVSGAPNGIDAVLSNVLIFENEDDEIKLSNIEGYNAKEMFKSTDENISLIKDELYKPQFMVAPNGNKYEVMIDNNGQLIAKSVIPTKCAMFGNSLMFGNTSQGVAGFGMCATREDKDFYAKINAFCLTLNPNYVANRYSAVPFETINSISNIASVVATTVASLSGDEDLIIIQAGDNTSASQAETIMPQSSMALLEAIRAKCPNARVCWPAIWYSSPQKMNCVRNACKKWGVTMIDISDLNIKENLEPIGGLIDFGAVGTDVWTLENVSNLVDNGNNNITVTFTYNSTEATTTLDVSSYTLNGTTLSYSGRYKIITLQAGHPGDRGMTAIANRIIYSMGMTDNEEYYELD